MQYLTVLNNIFIIFSLLEGRFSAVLNIKDNTIYLTRGDDAPISLALYTPDGKLFPVETIDDIDIIFSVRKKPMKQNTPPLIEKHFKLLKADGMQDAILQIEILEADTKFLKYGSYLYDVQYIYHGQAKSVITTVCKGDLELLSEIG